MCIKTALLRTKKLAVIRRWLLSEVTIITEMLYFNITGGVYFVTEGGQCSQSFTTDGPVLKLLYYEEKNVLITVTESLALTQHAVMPEGETKEMMKV